MKIDDLTLGNLRDIAALLQLRPMEAAANPVVGLYCIARCYAAGVHAGIVESVDGETAVLRDSRRLWSWKAVDGIALSGVAQNGIASGKLDVVNPVIYLTGVCELIPCTQGSEASIRGHK